MPVFKCLNKQCSEYKKKCIEPVVSYKWNGQEFVADRLPCPVCKQDRTELKVKNGFQVNVTNSSKRKWSLTSKGTHY